MAKKVAKGSFLAKMGKRGRAAFEAHKSDEVKYGIGDELPAGIEKGVAQLAECGFSRIESGDFEGEFTFRMRGVILSPKSFGGEKTENRVVTLDEPMYQTDGRSRKTVDQHFDFVLNTLKLFEVEVEEINIEDLQEVVEALQEERPYFKFRTWKGTKPKTGPYADRPVRTQTNFLGACEYDPDEEDEEDMVDETEEGEEEPEEDASGEPEEEEEDEDSEETEEVEENEEDEEVEEEDLGEVAVEADGGDEPSISKMTSAALDAGISEDVINETESWVEVLELMTQSEDEEGEEEGEEEEEEEEVDWEPSKGEMYYYKPPKARKRSECEVSAVFPKKQTCNLKSLDDGKVFKSVGWDKLQDVDG